MNVNASELTINGVGYVPKSDVTEMAVKQGEPRVIVRTYSAGVFAGYIKERNGQEVTLKFARRLWRLAGAASLSQLAVDGTSSPSECKFPCEVQEILLLDAIEIIRLPRGHLNL